MKVNIVFKSGKEIAIHAKRFACNRTEFGQLTGIEYELEKGQSLLFANLENIDAVYCNELKKVE